MREVAISMHSKYHAEIHHFCLRANEAQGLINFRHIYIPEIRQQEITSNRQIRADEICKKAFSLKAGHGLSSDDILILVVDADLYDHEDDEYFYVTNLDYPSLERKCPGIGIMSLYYLNPDSSFITEGGDSWKDLSETERRSVTSNSILLLLLSSIATLLIQLYSHEETLGCVMDYCQKPPDVLEALRGGFTFCKQCSATLKTLPAGRAIIEVAEELTEHPYKPFVKRQSNLEAVSSLLEAKILKGSFDVFLCHNNADKSAVKKIGEQLKGQGILPWLDEWELRPGFLWQDVLEKQIKKIRSAAVFVGKNGIGPWQKQELNAFIRQFVRRSCPVIPVILPYAEKIPKLPQFLDGMVWVDFRKKKPDPLEHLVWGITGKRTPVLK